MSATVKDKAALTAQTDVSHDTARANMNTNRKASIIRCAQKGAETIKQEG